MPIPLLGIFAVGSASSIATAGATSEVVQRRVRRIMEKYGYDYVQNAMDSLGIDLDVSNGLTDEAITAAINKTFLTGSPIQLESVFDGEKLRLGLIKVGLQKIFESLGFSGETTIAGVTIRLQDFITAEAIAQIAMEAGEIWDAASESKRIRDLLEAQRVDKTEYNQPRDMTQSGISNRERQARYRANHRRVWVPKAE